MSMKKEFDAMLCDKDARKDYIAQLSTDSDELRKRFMDPCRLGSEADWWARRRIEELEQQLAAKDDEIRELVTSDNKVVADLSRYVETLEQKIADKNDAYRAACAVVAKMHEAAIGEVTGPKLGVVEDVAELRQQLAEAQDDVLEQARIVGMGGEREIALRQQLAEAQSHINHLRMALADTEALELGTCERLAKIRQQLSAALAACKQKDDALDVWLMATVNARVEFAGQRAITRAAINIQPDDSALKAWLGEPVGEVKRHTGSLKDMAIIVWTDEQPAEGTKLYTPKGLK